MSLDISINMTMQAGTEILLDGASDATEGIPVPLGHIRLAEDRNQVQFSSEDLVSGPLVLALHVRRPEDGAGTVQDTIPTKTAQQAAADFAESMRRLGEGMARIGYGVSQLNQAFRDESVRLVLSGGAPTPPDPEIARLTGELDEARTTARGLVHARDTAYRERAHLVAHLCALFPSCWNYGDPDAPGWPVVYVTTPAGQLTWHIGPDDWHLFEHLKRDDSAVWDGHTTAEKYDRLDSMTRSGAGGQTDAAS